MLVHSSKQLSKPACPRSILYALKPHFKNVCLNLVINQLHPLGELQRYRMTLSFTKKGRHSLGAIPFFVAEVTAEKEGADCPGASKKL